MKRLVFTLLLVGLWSCSAVPTVADEDPQMARFVETPAYTLALIAERPIEMVDVTVSGVLLKLESPYCVVPDCVPNEAGYIRLTYPDEPDADYGRELVIQVVAGLPLKGTALFQLKGETLTRPATLMVQP